MRALVTGAGGFVGRHLVKELVDAGYETAAVDLCEKPSPCADGFPAGAIFRKCDLLDRDGFGNVISEFRPDAIFHLAAQGSAALSFVDPRGTLETNVIGTLNLLEAERTAGIGARIFVTGSSEEYGRRFPGEMPLGENSPIEPVSPYASSKAAQNLLSMQYFRAFGSRVVLSRSFSHTGPGQTESFVLPSFARQCARIKAGIDPPVIRTGNLDVKRDFLDVRDVVRAYRMLLEKGKDGETYNVSSGMGLDLGEALEKLISIAGIDVIVKQDPALMRPVDVKVLVGDSTKLRVRTGWRPEIAVDSMLGDLFRWWSARADSGI